MKKVRMPEWMGLSTVERFERLIREVDSCLPPDFVPLDDQQLAAGARRRPPELLITITQQRVPGPGNELVNEVTLSIRPESPRDQAARERDWTKLWQMREQLRRRVEALQCGQGVIQMSSVDRLDDGLLPRDDRRN
jgi:hypothetical protein